MINYGLVSDDIRAKYATDIVKLSTFKAHGVSEQAAVSYLKTAEGKLFWKKLVEADPAASINVISDRAIEQLTSGRDLPRMEVINEPLVKIVPAGEQVSPYSPYFAKESEFQDAIAKGHNLNDRFGLPVNSEAAVYDVYRIDPKGPTEVFVSEVAPTSELDGQVRHAGGARQYLVPNRGVFTEAVHVGSLGNDLTLHNTHVAGKGLGAAIAPLAETAAARGLHPGAGTAAKGLGVLGAAATAYDIADTTHDVSRLRGQGNDTAAQARIERFAVQSVAGWGGAAAGMGAGALAGVETGPGLLATGAVGGIVGAVAGDKVADWRNERKIYRQQDPQGQIWSSDPDHPDRGWTVDIPPLPGAPQGQRLTADPALADRLNFQANATSIELALGSPPQSRDPYTLPASDQDARSAREAPWTRDPDTQQWTREMSRVVDYRANHAVYETHRVEASSERAAELGRESQAVIARNATQTPAAMATRFQAEYERRGWAQYDPLPEAVTDALQHPGRIVGSDGDLYERNAQGQWTHDGVLWDSQAKDNLRHELDATYRQQQANAEITTLEAVRVTAPREQEQEPEAVREPVAAAQSPTMAAPAVATATQASTHPQQPKPQPAQVQIPEHLRTFSHEDHPLHRDQEKIAAGLEKARDGFVQGSNFRGADFTPDQLERIAAGLTAANGLKPLREINMVHLDKDGQLWASEPPFSLVSEKPRWISVPLDETLAKTPETIATDWWKQNVPAQVVDPVPVPPIDPEQLDRKDVRHPDNSRHELYTQTREALATEYERWGIQPDPAQLDRQAALSTVAARGQHLEQVSEVDFGFPNGRMDQPAVLLKRDPGARTVHSATVKAEELAQAPDVAASSKELQRVDQQVAQDMAKEQEQRRAREAEQQNQGPMLSGPMLA